MGPDILGGDSSDSEELSTIKIDEKYARRFEHNERQRAVRRYNDLRKKGLVPDDSDSESDSSEDSESSDSEANRRADLDMLKTLALVKKNDPKLYEKDVQLYVTSAGVDGQSKGGSLSSGSGEKSKGGSANGSDEGDEQTGNKNAGKKRKKKEKPLYLKDVIARNLLEDGPEFNSEDEVKYDRKVYDEKQKAGLKAFLEAEKAAAIEEDGDVFQEKRRPTSTDDDVEVMEEVEKHVKDAWNEEELDEDEKFLKDYISNVMKGTIKLDGWRNEIPEEVNELSEEEEELEKQESFESNYNFRFEEAEAAGTAVMDRVLGHSRIVEGSVRKKDSSRKRQRKNKEERMALAEHERREEVKHLKNVMKKEIEEKMGKFRLAAGIKEDKACKLLADELDGDFDPDEFNKKMGEMFDDNYYNEEDPDPDFGSGDEFNLGEVDLDKEDEPLGLSKDFVEEENTNGKDLIGKENESDNKEHKRRKKRKITTEEQELKKVVDDYYKLDYEDTIGDQKTRFKYKSVVPNRYGLSAMDILTIDDKALNQYVSLKRLAPYREKEWKVMHRKAQKELILYSDQSKKKSGKKLLATSGSKFDATEEETKPKEEEMAAEVKSSKKSRRNLRKKELKLSDSRLEAYGKKH